MLPKKLNVNSSKNKQFIAKQLNKMCRFLNNAYSINSGGCCYVAACIASLLEEDGFNFQICVCDDEKLNSTFDTIYHTCNHYFIKLGRNNINGEDFSYNFHRSFKASSKEIMEHYTENECDWNWVYDTDNNKMIKAMIKIFYEGITTKLKRTPNKNKR